MVWWSSHDEMGVSLFIYVDLLWRNSSTLYVENHHPNVIYQLIIFFDLTMFIRIRIRRSYNNSFGGDISAPFIGEW